MTSFLLTLALIAPAPRVKYDPKNIEHWHIRDKQYSKAKLGLGISSIPLSVITLTGIISYIGTSAGCNQVQDYYCKHRKQIIKLSPLWYTSGALLGANLIALTTIHFVQQKHRRRAPWYMNSNGFVIRF